MTLQLGVVLPTYNERKNLRGMVERLDKALAGIAWEVIIVDDNSPDGTSDEARALAQEDGRVRVIQRIGRRGLSSAAIEGMCATAAPVVAVLVSIALAAGLDLGARGVAEDLVAGDLGVAAG